MKKIALFLAVVLMCGVAMAQSPNKGERPVRDAKAMAEKRTEFMTKELSLTDAQKQKVLELNLAEAQQLEANRAEKQKDAQANREAKQQAKQTASAAYDAKLKSILTPEQYTKFTEAKAKCDGDKSKCTGDKSKKGGDKGKRQGGKDKK